MTRTRGKHIKLFLSGDYEFLTQVHGVYGLSGAEWSVVNHYFVELKSTTIHMSAHAGKHCCLWCLITKEDLQAPLEQRGPFPLRSVENIKQDHQKFIENGGNLKHAKKIQ